MSSYGRVLAPVTANMSSPRILAVRLSSLGDILLAFPALQKLKSHWPKAWISMLVKPPYASLTAACPWVDEALPYTSFMETLRRVRQGRFTHLLDLHGNWRSFWIRKLSNIPRQQVYAKNSLARRLLVHFGRRGARLRKHTTERYLEPLGAWGIPPSGLTNGSKPWREDGSATATVQKKLQADGVRPEDILVAVHPGAAWSTKRWLPERFAALIRRLVRELGAKVVLVGEAADRDLAKAVAQESQVEALDWTGRTTLPELVGLMPRLKLFITNDSGPMHLAAQSGVPVLALFGSTTRELGFFPQGTGVHRVLEADLACRPCALHGHPSCPEGHFLCMRLLTVPQVFEAAREMLVK